MKFILNLFSENEINTKLENKLFENKFDDTLLFKQSGLICLELNRESVDQTILELEKIGIKAKQVL